MCVCVCARVSLSIRIFRRQDCDLYRLLGVMDWINGRNCIENSYVFNFTKQERKLCIFGILKKILEFDGIASPLAV